MYSHTTHTIYSSISYVSIQCSYVRVHNINLLSFAPKMPQYTYPSLCAKLSVETGNYYSIHKPKKKNGNEEVASMECVEEGKQTRK